MPLGHQERYRAESRLEEWLWWISIDVFTKDNKDVLPLLRHEFSDQMTARFFRMAADLAMPSYPTESQLPRYTVLLLSHLLSGIFQTYGVPARGKEKAFVHPEGD